MVWGILIQGLGPGGRTIRAVAGGIGGFGNHIGAEGQLTGLGIATGIGRTNVEGVASFLIDRLELGACQVIAVGVFLIDFNETSLIDDIIDIQMEESTGGGSLGAAALAHILDGADLRTAGVTNVDNEVILTTVGAAGIVEIISAGINGCVGEAAVRLGENDNVTGHHVCISSGCIGILGNAASCLGSQVIEARIPGPNRCGGIAAAIHGGCLDGLMDVGRIDAFDIGQVVAHVVRHKGRTNEALLLELGDCRCSSGNGGTVSDCFIAVQKRAVIVISDIGQDIGRSVQNITGHILGNVQEAIILQPLDIETGVFQGTQNIAVVHFLGDGAHVCKRRDCIGVCREHGNAEGVFTEYFTGIVVLYGYTVGVLNAGIEGKVLFDGFGKLTAEGIKPKLIPFFQTHTVILRGLRPVLFRIFGRVSFRFGCFSYLRGFRRIRCFRTFRCFRNRRLRFAGRLRGCFRHSRFCRGLGAFIRGRIDRRHESQHQNKYQQQRQQPLAFCFHVFIVLSKVDIEKGPCSEEQKP